MTSDTDPTEDIVESMTQLGLSTYEARVFVALVKIGTATASEIATVVDVPRSQVYGAADELHNRGLVSIQQARPKRYRAVPLEEAEAQLARRLETKRRAAFDQLDSLQEKTVVEKESNNVWTIEGTTAIQERAAHLVSDATHRLILGGEATIPPDSSLYQAITSALETGTHVYALDPLRSSLNQGLLKHESMTGVELPAQRFENVHVGLLVIGDDETILVSVLTDDPTTGGHKDVETAIWSERSTFAQVLYQLIMGSLSDHIERS